MVLKNIDDKSFELTTLKKLLILSQSDKQKALIEKDLNTLNRGYESEKENAYYLNFHFEEKKHSTLIHDIRIEHNGKTAQFDHILITPIGITVLESKSFNNGILTINNDGSLTVKSGKNIDTYPNPIEQNNRHIKVLDSFLKDKIDLSLRFKIMGGIPIEQKVIIHPNTTISNKNLPDGFERSDSFATNRNQELDKIGIGKAFIKISTFLTSEMIKEITNKIIAAHKPIKFDYSSKYKISNKTQETNPQEEKNNEQKRICPKCNEGRLILRKRKNQKYENKYQSDEFYGCSRFPKCKYVEEIKLNQ